MLNERRGAARDVAEKLFALETAIDNALSCAGELTIALPAARKKAGVSAVVGHEATQLAAETLMALCDARSKIVLAHSAFAQVQADVGLKVYGVGSLWKLSSKSDQDAITLVSSQAA